VIYVTTQLFYPRESDQVPTVWEPWWSPGSIEMGAENLNPTGIGPPDRPARSESLYRLSYRGPQGFYCLPISAPNNSEDIPVAVMFVVRRLAAFVHLFTQLC